MLSQGPSAGFEAWVEGKDHKNCLNEHQIEHHPKAETQPPYTECFLETIDEAFTINLRRMSDCKCKYDLQVFLYIDGSKIEKGIAWRPQISQLVQWQDTTHEREGKLYTSSFQFAPMPTTDDLAKVTIDPVAMKKLGTIEITLECGRYTEAGYGDRGTSSLVEGTMSEKAKKFAYSVGTTDSTEYKTSQEMHWTFFPKGNRRLFHRFVFKYRPKAVLEQMRIIDTPEDEQTTPAPQRKRKRSSAVIDLADEEESIVKEEGEEDVKPNLRAKRVKYLEEQVRMLTGQLKQKEKGKKANDGVVDLTQDSDED
ncbi:uncharacterized protein I303_102914 [Kwoniella dejecticola CBS 10117]|uniref:DUF7918 domain-containing protein n=1 Tax=Kwoniella dejecticola CBS 10117 TaxID=1296121 RepID=A0A1A6AA30_9TREE|nr:uncharacterized protein I303_02934 [Kwoniella dejecticola CBS 10117]OBR86913.1 hypothetical protein I303_02934 [Kwoniella dejecticola CBS 10117]